MNTELPKLDGKPGRKNYLANLLLEKGNSVSLSFYLNHYYTHISKQKLEYIFPLNKYLESLGCRLDKYVDFTNFVASWPKETILPNLHVLQDHAADFIETWSSPPSHGEHGSGLWRAWC